MENEFELPEYYNTKKPKEKEDLVKRKCFACGKEKAMGSLKDIVMTVADQEPQRIIKHLTVYVGSEDFIKNFYKINYLLVSNFLSCKLD